jgi:hypothetical protein
VGAVPAAGRAGVGTPGRPDRVEVRRTFNRRFQLDSIVARLAWAAVRTQPQPYRAVVADA